MSGPFRHIICLLLVFLLVNMLHAQLIQAPMVFRTDGFRAPVVNWAPVKTDRKWGYIDTEGRVKIQPRFDAAEEFMGNYAVVAIGNKAYVIDTTGTILTPSGYDQLLQLEDSIFAVYRNTDENGEGGWGAEKIIGQEILPAKYDKITRVTYFLFSCRNDSSVGFFHRNGTLIAPVKYDTGWMMQRYLVLRDNGLLGVRTESGTLVLPDSCSALRLLQENMVAGMKNGLWGAADKRREMIVPFAYDSLSVLGTRFISAKRNDSILIYCNGKTPQKAPGKYTHAFAYGGHWVKAFTTDKKCAIIDTSGKLVVPPLYDDVLSGGNGTWIVIANKMWGVVSADGTVIVPLQYTFIQPFRNGLSVVKSNRLQGLINERGNVLQTPINAVISIKGNMAKVMRPDAKVEFIKTDGQGNVLSRDEYEEVRVIKIGGDNSYSRNVKGGGALQITQAPRGDSLMWFYDVTSRRFGLRDAYLGDTLIPPTYAIVRKTLYGYTQVGRYDTVESVTLNGRGLESAILFGLFDDSTGKFVIQPRYSMLQQFNYPADRSKLLFRCVRRDGVAGLVRADGTEQMLQASHIDNLSNGVAAFCIGGKWEFSHTGQCITTWQMFSLQYGIAGSGPFRSMSESRAASNYYVSHTGGKWGFINANGTVVIPPQYDGFIPSQGGTCIVRTEKKWGMTDSTGKQLMPFEYDGISYLYSGSQLFVQTQMNTVQMGCIDTLGNVVIPLQYKKIIPLGQGYMGVTTTGKWGVVKTDGTVIAEEKYMEVRRFSEGYAAVRYGRKWGIIDSTGQELIAPEYDDVGVFSNGMCAVKKSLYWGYVNTSGQLIIPCVYTAAGPFLGPTAPVRTREGAGLIDRGGKLIVKPTYSLIERLGATPVYSVKKNNTWGLMNREGKLLVSPRFAKLKDIGSGRIAYLEHIHWGVIDTNGAVITVSLFDRVGEFSDGLCPVSVDSKWGYIRTDGSYAVTPRFRSAGQFGSGLAYVVPYGDKTGFIDTTGHFRFRLGINGGTTVFSESKTIVREHRPPPCQVFYTRHGHRLNRMQYAQALPFRYGCAPVRAGALWGLINFSGRYLVQPSYTAMSPFSDGVSIVQHNATYGLHRLDGSRIFAPEYDVIRTAGSFIRVQRNNGLGYLSLDGSLLWDVQD